MVQRCDRRGRHCCTGVMAVGYTVHAGRTAAAGGVDGGGGLGVGGKVDGGGDGLLGADERHHGPLLGLGLLAVSPASE